MLTGILFPMYQQACYIVQPRTAYRVSLYGFGHVYCAGPGIYHRRQKDGKPRVIIARFLRYRDREFIFSKTCLLKDSQFGISADLPKEIVKRCKEQFKKLIEARKSSKLAFFSRAEPAKLYIDRVLVPL